MFRQKKYGGRPDSSAHFRNALKNMNELGQAYLSSKCAKYIPFEDFDIICVFRIRKKKRKS